jgi:hypothetical protein
VHPPPPQPERLVIYTAIFPEYFQRFTVTLKNYLIKILLPQTHSAVCRSINKNKKTLR